VVPTSYTAAGLGPIAVIALGCFIPSLNAQAPDLTLDSSTRQPKRPRRSGPPASGPRSEQQATGSGVVALPMTSCAWSA